MLPVLLLLAAASAAGAALGCGALLMRWLPLLDDPLLPCRLGGMMAQSPGKITALDVDHAAVFG